MADDRRKLLQEADRAARRGKLGDAAEIYRKLSVEIPRDLSLQQKLADALARSGEEREAGDLFARLAEQYWESGHRSRAIATLKRAIRIRSKSPRLLFRLGGWTLEQGHPADARQPLLEAAELEYDAEIAAEGRESFEQLARHCANDPAVHEAHVRVVEALDDGEALARAGAGLAVALVRAGRPEQAAEALMRALEADLERMSALERLAHLVEVVDDVDADALLAEMSSRGAAERVATSILVAAWHARHARAEPGANLLRGALADEEGWTAQSKMHAADVMTELEQNDAAAELVERVVREESPDATMRRRIVRVLHRVLAGAPDHPRAAGLLREVTRGGGRDEASGVDAGELPAVEAPIAAAASFSEPGPAAFEKPPPPREGPLPAEPMQIVIEARALLEHGLARRAMKVLDRLDPRWSGHPDVRQLMDRFAEAGVLHPETVAVPPAARTGPVPRADADEDLFVLTEDDETGVLLADSPDGREYARTAAQARATAAAETAVGMGEAVTEVLAVDPVEDDETRYEVAVGLIQMGLESQAVALLEECLERPQRRAEAAIELVRIHISQGDMERALGVAEKALDAPDLTMRVRTELLAEVAAVAMHQGRASLARESIDELEALAPDHPSIGGLKARVAATEN